MLTQKNRTVFLLLVFYCIFFTASAQQTSPGNTYAIVIGISAYQDARIPQLSYAHKDASLFAGWLQSKSGGNVPLHNIQLLTNENATISAVYNALDWVKEKASTQDIIYIYFSGHGDMETRDSISHGYLLLWNSPPNNYCNNALSVNDLNNTANTITTKNDAKIILITDACHSGNLAGDYFKGKQFTAHNLNKVLNNQVRMASCKENEEAAEGPAWGGGRGVFSYYLLIGLNGMAEKDDVVKLKDLQYFLDSAFLNDHQLKVQNHQQSPVIDGNLNFELAKVDYATLFASKKGAAFIPPKPSTGLQTLRSVGPQPIDYFFAIAKQSTLDDTLNFERYLSMLPDEIPLKIVSDYIDSRKEYDSLISLSRDLDSISIYTKYASSIKEAEAKLDIDDSSSVAHLNSLVSNLNYPSVKIKNEYLEKQDTINKLKTLQKQLQDNAYSRTLFSEKFVQLVHQKAQDMINAYLKGDLTELEKRQYYYSGKRNYRNFLPVIKTAIVLSPESNYLNSILKIKEAYLAGVIDRLDIATNQSKTESLLNSAFAHEHRALQLEPYAAYIHNELGNLYFQNQQYDSASYYFNFATLLSPTWAIPWSNKIRLNLALNNLPKAKEAIEVADSLQPNLAYINTNAGLVAEKEGNFLAAEGFYLNAITQNKVHYLPFERLGHIYIQTGDYAKADSFLYESKQRKEKFAVNDTVFTFGIVLGGREDNKANNHYMNPCKTSYDSTVAGWHTYIMLATGISKISDSSIQKQQKGEQLIKEALIRLPNIPLANHYLAKKYFKDGNWQKAELELKKASSNYLASDQLEYYIKKALTDSLIANTFKGDFSKLSKTDTSKAKAQLMENINNLVDSSCLLSALIYLNYDELEDYYMLASVYEKHGFTEDAIKEYKIIAGIENIRQMNQAMLIGIMESSKATTSNTGDKLEYLISYRKELIQKYNSPIKMGGTLKASRLLEKAGLFEDAEKVLLQQVVQNRAAGYARQDQMNQNNFGSADLFVFNYYWLYINKDLESECYNFYVRMLAKFPRNAYWYKKAGLFLYNRLALTYYQIPIDQRNSFYKYSLDYAYPFAGSLEGPNQIRNSSHSGYVKSDNTFLLPGTNEEVKIDTTSYDPVKQANYFLQQAIRFSGDVYPDVALLEPIADLQSWMNNKDSAVFNYEYLLQKQPENATLRNKLIDNLVFNKDFTKAYIQLDSLNKRKQINPVQLLLLANYSILSKNNNYASSILQAYIPENSFEKNEKQYLLVKQSMIIEQHKKALAYIKVLTVPEARVENDYTDTYKKRAAYYSESFYTQARAYAFLGENKKALAILKNVIDSGYNYQYVLNADHAWEKLRSTKKWNAIIHSRPFYNNYDEEKYQESNNQNTVLYRIPILKL